MQQQRSSTRDQLIEKRNFTLLELLDRLLDKGAMVKGEIMLSVADIDLVYLNLGLLLSSVKTIEEAAQKPLLMHVLSGPSAQLCQEVSPETRSDEFVPAMYPDQHASRNQELHADLLPTVLRNGLDHYQTAKANIDPKNVEKGLARLVLTVVDLLRKLMEKQAIRRMDAGQLPMTDIERMGHTFLALDEKIEQMKEVFGLQDEELNLDLGPLGELL